MSKALPINFFVPNPTLTSVTPTGGAAASVTYKLVAVAVDGTKTAVSAGVTDSAAPTTLDGTHFETLLWTDPAHTDHILAYRTAGGPSQGLIATVAAGVGTLVDTGLAGDGSTPSATNGTGVGSPVDVSELSDLTVQVGGTFSATLQLKGILDGAAAFASVGSAISSAGFTDVSATAKALSQIRVDMTAYTSGTPVVVVDGHQQRG